MKKNINKIKRKNQETKYEQTKNKIKMTRRIQILEKYIYVKKNIKKNKKKETIK